MFACFDLTVPRPRGDGRLFDGWNVEIDDGEWIDVVGDSGSGKSILFAILTLERRPEEGRLVVQGRNLERIDEADLDELRRQFGTCRQPVELLEDRTVLENVLLPLVVRGEVDGARELADSHLESVGLAELADARVANLSSNERRGVAVARATVGSPAVVAVDEPAVGREGRLAGISKRALGGVHEEGATVLTFGCRRPEYSPSEARRLDLGGQAATLELDD